MKAICPLLVCLALMFPGHSVHGDKKAPQLTDYQKAVRGLRTGEICPGLHYQKMLDICIPTSKRTLGQFTEYRFVLMPDYHGITIFAKNGHLRRAIEWSCTYTCTYFNDLTPDDEKRFGQLWMDNQHFPFDRFIGRFGWERPRMRDWMRLEPKSPSRPTDAGKPSIR